MVISYLCGFLCLSRYSSIQFLFLLLLGSCQVCPFSSCAYCYWLCSLCSHFSIPQIPSVDILSLGPPLLILLPSLCRFHTCISCFICNVAKALMCVSADPSRDPALTFSSAEVVSECLISQVGLYYFSDDLAEFFVFNFHS